MSFELDYVADDDDGPPAATPAEIDTAAMTLLVARQLAYARVFQGGGSSVDAKMVMDDLAHFCRAFASTHHDNPQHSARLDGRREVYLRIMEHSRLPIDVLFDYYHRRQT